MATWLVTGAGGMLGRDLVPLLRDEGETVVACGHAELDVTDDAAVDAAVEEVATVDGGLVVVNLASWTDVDGAEAAEDAAYAVNADGAWAVARACARHGARLIHVSTDYVFDGASTEPYAESAGTCPVNAYGRTKAAGEQAVLTTLPEGGAVLRTAWLYGEHGRNFVTAIAKAARERDWLDVVADQVGQPTWTGDVARRIAAVGRLAHASGVYHATNAGTATRAEFAQAILAGLGMDADRVRPTTSEKQPRAAHRPAYSVLGHERWRECGLPPLRHWREALAEALPAVSAAVRAPAATVPGREPE